MGLSMDSSHKKSLLAAVAAVFVVSPAFSQQRADNGTISLDEIVVTAARADRRVSDTPQTINVIDRADIEKQLQFENNPAALLAKIIPGYSVNTQTISSASESFRGRDLLVMIDGVPMNT